MWTIRGWYEYANVQLSKTIHHAGPPGLGLLVAAVCALFLLGCQERPSIRLIPVFPADEPDLLAAAGVFQLQLKPIPIDLGDDKTPDAPPQTVVEQGQPFSLDLAKGTWQVVVQGVDADGGEVVYGVTPRFEVARGKGGKVRFFLGRSMAFNLVDLEPASVAEALAGLTEHTATAFDDEDGHPWILVAGGRRDESPDDPVALALLIDPIGFSVEQLPSLSCARSGHTGFAVQTEQGVRVVLAGGDDKSAGCRGSLDVYDPVSRTFERIDPLGNDREAVAAPEQVSATDPTHTGRVVVAGNPRHVVHLLSGEIDSHEELATGPDAPMFARSNAIGQILVVTANQLFVDNAVQKEGDNDPCYDQDYDLGQDIWDEAAVYGPIEERDQGELYALTNERFLFAGGLAPGGGEPEFGWSIVVTGPCEVHAYGQGRRPPGTLPTHGFALIDLFPSNGIGLIAAGGWDDSGQQRLRRAVLLTERDVTVPTWHDLSNPARERPVALKVARAGHAAARASHDGSWWVIGGGDDHRPEVFVRGEGEIIPEHESFRRRNPSITSMAVLDTTPGTTNLNLDVATSYPAELFDQAAGFATILFVTARADRGIGDGLLTEVAVNDHCTEGGDPGFAGVATGDVPNEDLGTVIDVITGEGQGSPAPNTFEKAVELLEDIANVNEEVGPLQPPDHGWGCAWRQLVKVGLIGLDKTAPGGDYDPGLDVTLGVTVLLIVTTDDDCSQHVFGAQDPPSAEVLATEHCTTTADGAVEQFDDYFGLPPSGTFEDELAALIEGLAWDMDDLIVAVVGNTSDDTPECEAAGYGTLRRPRRLLDTVGYLGGEDVGAQTELVEVCGSQPKSPLAQGLGAVGDRIRARNPLQACVPTWVPTVEVEVDTGKDLNLPVEPGSPEATTVAADVAAHCWMVFKDDKENPDELPGGVWEGVTVSPTTWWAGVNPYRDQGCDWLVRSPVLTTSDGKDVDNAEIICVP
jgi:hypothetical protein